MSTQYPHRNLVLLTLLFLLSACGPNSEADKASSTDAQNGASSGGESEVVTESPVGQESTAPVSEEEKAEAAAIAQKEKETGVADLREFVDEIAPEPDVSDPAVSEPDSSDSSESTAPESGTKQENSSSNDKGTEAPANDIQENPAFMVALADGGLQTVDVQTGSTLDILFEVDGDIAVSTVSISFGDPTETVDTSECPAGPLKITTWPNGLSLNTLDEAFVGWSIRPNSGSENLTTIAGVGIGTSVKNLQEAYEVEVFESSLGTEFNVGQMSGILSSDQPDGEIINLWAGLNCIFR